MKQIFRHLIIIAACSVALPLTAQEFRAINSLYVNRVDKNVIEVIGRPGAHKEDYWCGVGDYVRRVVRAPWKTKIYVVSGIGRGVTTGARDAVRFTMSPDAIGIEPYESNLILDVLTVGYSRSLTYAFDMCHRRPGFFHSGFGIGIGF
ncbi:hypothetical protein DL239_19310 [Sedimentitalea sp. CY04]|uniref:DUF3575 domain-containing protein n=1 Tax=Parasedimentitalea denitrificans TaxID=2211118 RepID=A0ABX0WEL2_9RHOB|nr:hypothetical protein [Sedimentitalea sp. CY04]NIZ63117.1 hypothetical protein [Sedimentitalea sp. CY04]